MIGLFLMMLGGAMIACGIDMVFIHPQPVYGNDWLAPIIGAVAALCAWTVWRGA